MDVTDAIRQRWSCRAFLDTPIPDETIRYILTTASWAPSGVNSQPWEVAVVKGHTRQSITERLIQARQQGISPDPDYAYYPDEWVNPFRARRIACGKAMYAALDISKEDKTRQQVAWENNYRYFGAPVALFFFISKQLNKGSWVDMGMFIQNVMLAAQNCGLATCPQASLAEYPNLVRQVLNIDEHLALICGMSVGYADTHAAVNQYRLERESVDNFSHWYD